MGTGNLAQVLELVEILLNEDLAHLETEERIFRNLVQIKQFGEANFHVGGNTL